MPSYRVTVDVGLIRPGVAAPDVLPLVAAAIAKRTTVEANDIKISSGRPQLVIRFTGSDPGFAKETVQESLADIDDVIEVLAIQVTARHKNRWYGI